jgi:hypothetical protein
MPYVNRDGVKIFYEDSGGDGEVIFMTHGFGSGSKMWDGQMDLANKFRLIRYVLSSRFSAQCVELFIAAIDSSCIVDLSASTVIVVFVQLGHAWARHVRQPRRRQAVPQTEPGR